MLKKIVCALLCVILCGGTLAGCSLFSHNDEKDAQQIIVTINPIVSDSYTSPVKHIYKKDLNRQLVQNLSNYMQQYSLSQENAVKRILEEMIQNELVLIEAERFLAEGLIPWGQKQDNQLMQGIYSVIDSQLQSIKNTILSEYDEDEMGSQADEPSTETTYPVKKDESTMEDLENAKRDEAGNVIYEKDENGEIKLDKKGNPIPEYNEWKPEKSSYPAVWGSPEQISLDNQALSRFIEQLRELVADDFKVTAEDSAKFKQDDAALAAAAKAKPDSEDCVYVTLGKTHYMYYLIGKSLRDSILVQLMQEYFTDGVDALDEEVVAGYNNLVEQQKSSYNATVTNYDTAIKNGSDTIVYNPYYAGTEYFYVKHILLPFSDAQKKQLTDYKANLRDPDSKDVIAFRKELVNSTVVYPHKNGEDDKTRPMSVKDVFGEVTAAMAAVASSPKEAERTFDDLIYLYNTDEGIFSKAMGYAVKVNATDNSGYMEEFYKGAIELFENHSVGQILPEYVITDYGVHIMYFASTVRRGDTVGLYEYQTPGQYKTIYDIMEEKVLASKQQKAFTDWLSRRITPFMSEQNKTTVVRYEKRYKDLYTATTINP